MTLEDFKNWLDGYSEAMSFFGQKAPDETQWRAILAKFSTVKMT